MGHAKRLIDVGWIGEGTVPLAPERFGAKAAWLSRLAMLGLPVPPGFALAGAAEAGEGALAAALDEPLRRLEELTGARLGDPDAPLLVAVRPSAPGGGGGAAPSILNLGITEATLPALARRYGERVAHDLYRRLIQSWGIGVLGLDGDEFDHVLHEMLDEAWVRAGGRFAAAATAARAQPLAADPVGDPAGDLIGEDGLDAAALAELARRFLGLIEQAGGSFPQDARAQLTGAVRALARAWESPRARLKRAARGIDEDAPLAIIVQEMVLGLGPDPSGAGLASGRDELTGERRLSGCFLPQAQGEEALAGPREPLPLLPAPGGDGPSLAALCPEAVRALEQATMRLEAAFGDAFTLEFTIEAGRLWLLEARPQRRSARAALRIAVELAEAGAISREEALLRVDPAVLEEHLHPSLAPGARRDVISRGLPASPGAASGPLVFSPEAAERAATEGRPAILALIETGPEDIRGMHAALGVLTMRGGMTSHAAVVARGLGRPCVVGAKDLDLDRRAGVLRSRDGRVFREGDVVTVDGSGGQILAGAVETVPPEITGAFATLMEWADAVRRMRVRANADTGEDAAVARRFGAEGIGLCRTEHMFFKHGRIAAMREMILAETSEERRIALEKLLPMQRGDFVALFRAMAGLPVVIRLLDPPLHEFLPHGEAELGEMARSLGVPVAKVRARARELAEFNPMLGNRGCRIGIAYPEIYEMQARAIFEAACEAAEATGQPVRPEIMVPLVSAVREFEVIKEHIEGVAAAVRAERGEMVDYRVGVMIETPRAALRAGDIAAVADFISFGTNDLTQLVYGLSRDDAGRFLPDYVAKGVYPRDPFNTLDLEGVGELIRIAAERARARRPEITVGLCGEHGGDPRSVRFCEESGFDYVSCSPYRVPVARLAAAQATLLVRDGGPERLS